MMLPPNVSRSAMATQRLGSVKVLVQPEKDSLEAMATLFGDAVLLLASGQTVLVLLSADNKTAGVASCESIEESAGRGGLDVLRAWFVVRGQQTVFRPSPVA